jgi:hypothetical protein
MQVLSVDKASFLPFFFLFHHTLTTIPCQFSSSLKKLEPPFHAQLNTRYWDAGVIGRKGVLFAFFLSFFSIIP